MTERASKKQKELLDFIGGFIQGYGYGPTYREIMRALGYKSVSTVAVHVDNLIAKGYLRKKDNSARSLEVVMNAKPVSDEAATQPTREQLDWLVDVIAGRLNEFKRAYSREAYEQLQTLIATLKILAPEDVYAVQADKLEALYTKHKQ